MFEDASMRFCRSTMSSMWVMMAVRISLGRVLKGAGEVSILVLLTENVEAAMEADFAKESEDSMEYSNAVSYTHLTLPTKRIV